MKQILITIGIILVVCVLGVVVYLYFNQSNIVDQVELSNIPDIKEIIVDDEKVIDKKIDINQLKDWNELWKSVDSDFNVENFHLESTSGLTFKNPNDIPYIKGNATYEILSPNKTKVLTLYFGVEPDSYAGLANLVNNTWNVFSQPQCGTPCIVINGYWINNDKLVFVGNTEVFEVGQEGNVMPFYFVIDLIENTSSRYIYNKSYEGEVYFSTQ